MTGSRSSPSVDWVGDWHEDEDWENCVYMAAGWSVPLLQPAVIIIFFRFNKYCLIFQTASNREFKSSCMKGFAMLAFHVSTFECTHSLAVEYGKLKEPVLCILGKLFNGYPQIHFNRYTQILKYQNN